MEALAGRPLDDDAMAEGIAAANTVRDLLDQLRRLVYTAEPCPLPALEMLVAEMLAIHYCSDRDETIAVLTELVEMVRGRVEAGMGVLDSGAVKTFWVNPVADLRVMNMLEQCGGRLCGSDFMFCHGLDEIPTDLPPMDALAHMVLADPMVGPAGQRAERICGDIGRFGAEAVVVSRIGGASHCATEGTIISQEVRRRLSLPVVEIEVPTLADAVAESLRTRLGALVETSRLRRQS
jgi:benzoyl-CoA reductase/2-hydroxyglutaryl-CoA dehydratase subunit BcrC/BadD/HgdB